MCLIIQGTSWLFWESSIPREPNWETRRPWRLLSSSCRCCTSCTHQPPRNCFFLMRVDCLCRGVPRFSSYANSRQIRSVLKQEPVAHANLALSASSSSSESPTPPNLHHHHLLSMIVRGWHCQHHPPKSPLKSSSQHFRYLHLLSSGSLHFSQLLFVLFHKLSEVATIRLQLEQESIKIYRSTNLRKKNQPVPDQGHLSHQERQTSSKEWCRTQQPDVD